ncbi:MAG: VOC family protein [Caulobacterales bacterium]|nr:VOC family protein [Caulobacterales bacterium]
MINGLDHIALVVSDLDAAEAGYRRLLGRTPNWRGTMHGASHVWFQLGTMALDVSAPTGEGPVGDTIRGRLDEAGEGIWGIGFSVSDLGKAQHRLERVGIPAYARDEVSTNPETGATREWVTAGLRSKSTHGASLFLVENRPDAIPWPEAEAVEATITGLDHVVVNTPEPERAAALYGARLGLDMKLDRSNPDWGTRLMFFRCGDLVVEVAHDRNAGVSDGPDSLWGLSWRVADLAAAHARLTAAGAAVSEVRTGRKPGTAVFTVKDAPGGVPTLVIGPQA